MGGWAQDAMVALRERSAQLAAIQAVIDADAGIQAALAQIRAREGSIFSSSGREQFFAGARALAAAMAAAGVSVPEGYTLDVGSGKIEKDSGGLGWLGWTLIGVGVGVATWGIGFGFAGLGGAGAATGGSTAAAGAVIPSATNPLVYSAVVPTITSQGASAAVYGSALAAGASAAAPAVAGSIGSTAATAGTTAGASTAGAIAKQIAARAPQIAGLFAPKPSVPDTAVPFYTPEGLTAERPLSALLSDPLVLAGLLGVVVVAIALARR